MRTRTVRVLLVEDDDGDAVLVEALLEEARAPFILSRARSLAEAERMLADAECVLLDLGLPDAQGLDSLFIAAGIHGESLHTNGALDPAKIDAALAAENARATYTMAALV